MIWLYQLLLKSILWVIKIVTPSQGPEIILTNEKKWRPNGLKPKRIDTKYGFPIDRWDKSIQGLDGFLSMIPVFDLEAEVDPELTRDHLDQKYSSRVPTESKDPKSLTDFLVNNTGSYFLELRENDMYVADFSDYEQYQVRHGYEKYGGKVFIKDGQIIEFEYQGKKYPGNDQHMDKIVRATLCIKLMVEMHALRTHLGTSQRKIYEYSDKYDENHPLADFLYISTYSGLDVNRRIPILVGFHGLVVRLFALTEGSYQQLLKNTLAKDAFSREEILGTEGTAWNKNIIGYVKLIDNFISGLTKDENEQKDLSNFFIAATALHNQFGDAQTYSMVVSKFFLPKIYTKNPGFISSLDQNLLIGLLYAVTPRYPLIIDETTPKIFTNHEQRKHWKTLQKAILENYEVAGWFDPKTMETSVGF